MADQFRDITQKYYKGNSAFTKSKDKSGKSVVLGNNSEEEIQANRVGSEGQIARLGTKRYLSYLKKRERR